MSAVLPILYSFRRCPYAIRARMAIAISAVSVDLIEVDLRNKPLEMLRISPKGTVPVLSCSDGSVLEQSIDIMRWALLQNDPQAWLQTTDSQQAFADSLLLTNDGVFKRLLDRYKYSIRFPDLNPTAIRNEAFELLLPLFNALELQPFILGTTMKWVDIALFPFIRQFAGVDKDWFFQNTSLATRRWFDCIQTSELFERVMSKSCSFNQEARD